MSTSSTHPGPSSTASKPTPRTHAASLTSAAPSPARSVPSPARLSASTGKTTKSPHKHPPSAAHTPLASVQTIAGQTPTPSGRSARDSSPAAFDGILSRARAGTGASSTGLGANGLSGPATASEGRTPNRNGLGLNLGPSPTGPDAALLAELGLREPRDAEALNAFRTKEVTRLIGQQWGYVSPENVQRCVERLGGLECLWEDGTGPADPQGRRPRTLSIAGNEILLEIEWRGEQVVHVELSFPKLPEATAHDKPGSEILLHNLTASGHAGYIPLEAFAKNLRHLANLDRLGRERISAFAALTGLQHSLEQLHQRELAGAEGTKPSAQQHVLQSKSGRPVVHSKNTLGLRLEYWIDRPNLAADDEDQSIWALQLGCEQYDTTIYPAIRLSDAWLGEDVLTDSGNIDWQDPPPSVVPTVLGDGDAMDVDLPVTLLPQARFVATLDPPITIPLKTAMDLFVHLGQPLPQEVLESTSMGSLLFPTDTTSPSPPTAREQMLRRVVDVTTYAHGEEATQRMATTLTLSPELWARTVREIPFTHPRQLVEILPTLRQWAAATQLLCRAMTRPSAPRVDAVHLRSKGHAPFEVSNGHDHREDDSDNDSDDSEPLSKSSEQKEVDADLDLALTCPTLVPRADFDVSIACRGQDLNLGICVGPNAELEIDDPTGAMPAAQRQQAAQVLRVSQDFVFLAAWCAASLNG